jgi:hypothetical protein
MKRSTKFLILAVVVPAVVHFVGVGAVIAKIKDKSSLPVSIEAVKKETLLITDFAQKRSTPIGAELRIEVEAVDLEARFDPMLSGTAEVAIEADRDKEVKVLLSPTQLVFSRQSDGKGKVKVQLRLPGKYKELSLHCRAARCLAEGSLNSTLLEIKSDASESTLGFASVVSQRFELKSNSGEMDFSADSFQGTTLQIDTNAGESTWKVKKLEFMGKDKSWMKVHLNAGSSSVIFAGVEKFGVDAKVNAGQLSLQQGKNIHELSGLKESLHLPGPAGSPQLEFKVNVGNLKVRSE